MKRAYAYERMLNNTIAWDNAGGYQSTCSYDGTVSQALFFLNRIYPNAVAVQMLQAQWPYPSATSSFQNTETNDLYPYLVYYPTTTPTQAVEMVRQMAGVSPVTTNAGGCPGFYRSGYTNYVISKGGFGEAGTILTGGYDGRYGTILPWLVTFEAAVGVWDTNMSPATLSAVNVQARATVDGFAHFISPNENYQGLVDYFTLAQEDYITYRDPYNPNADGKNFFVSPGGYQASDPGLGINSAYELRAAYLETQYGVLPSTGSGGGAALQYLKTLSSYETTVRSLVGVNPASLTPLPGEPGQPNSAFVDPQIGAVAIYYNGERFYMNANWRNNGGVSDLARIHDTTATEDRAALVLMPYNSATVQLDGNLSGGLLQPWVVRYGQWLIAGNPTANASMVQLPAGSGLALDLVSSNTYNLGAMVPVPAGGTVALHMPLVTTIQPVASGTYVVSNFFSKLVMNVPGGSTSPGTQLNQVSATGAGSQTWVFTYNGSGYYTISNAASGLLLDNPSGSTGNGTVLDQQTAASVDNQLWQLVPSGSGFNLVNKYSGLLADIVGGSVNSGALLDLGTNTAGQSQAWQLVAATTSSAALQPILNGTNAIVSANSWLALDNNGSSTSGAQIIQNNPAGTNTQRWVFTANGGYYTIMNVASGLYLTDPNGSTGPQSLQQQTLATGRGANTNSQLWALVPNGAGYTVVNKAGGNDFDEPFSTTQVGYGILVYPWGGGLNQMWVMVPPPGAPTGLTVAPGYGTAVLNWTAGTNYPGYLVKRSTSNGGPYTVIGTTSATSYADSSVTSGQTYYYVLSSTNAYGESTNSGQVSVTITGALLFWQGGVNPNWDIGVTTNWLQALALSYYQDAAAVIFDDSASSSTVILAANVAPATVTFNNSSLNYTLNSSGGFGLVGTNWLAVNGTASLTLNNLNNSFSGGSTFNGAAINLSGVGNILNPNILGSGPVTLNAGTLQYAPGGTHNSFTYTNQLGLNGGILFANDGNEIFGTTNSTIMVNNQTMLQRGWGHGYPYDSGGKNLELDGVLQGGGGLTLNGVGNSYGESAGVWVCNPSNTYSGLITVNATSGSGLALTLGTGTALQNATVDIEGVASGTPATQVPYGLAFAGATSSVSRVVSVVSNAVIGALQGNGKISLQTWTNGAEGAGRAVTLNVGGNNASTIYSGIFSGTNGSLVKSGNGTFILTGTNTYNGPTTVSNGELVVSTAFAGHGNFIVGDGATLGVTNLNATSSAAISNLTLGATGQPALEFENISSLTTAPFSSAGNLILNATCLVKIIGTNGLAAGNTYPLISYAGSLSGTFGNFILQMPAGMNGTLVNNAHQLALTILATPSVPTGLSALAGDTQVLLTWNGSSGATNYNVWRSTTSGSGYATIAGVTTTNYTDTVVTNGTTYYYEVSAVNGGGASTNSSPVSAQPLSSVPPQISLTSGNGSLQLNWPTDHRGWLLQSQTNPPATGLGTNWVTIPGSGGTNQAAIAIGPTNGCVFFRLVYP